MAASMAVSSVTSHAPPSLQQNPVSHVSQVPSAAHAEQSFPAEPEHPIAFAPVPVRNWRASAAMGYEYDSGVQGGTTQQFLPFALRFEYGALSLSLATSRVSIDGERIVGGFSIPG
ncbi:hypothetical protein, partial [Salinicola sp.]|uniref:hypothetical protein n=1 Tax=Salinicola sp. TaxID=1978524 RepID=UPI0025F7B06C